MPTHATLSTVQSFIAVNHFDEDTYFHNLTASGNITISGTLTVSGTNSLMGVERFGDNNNYTEFGVEGHQLMVGNAISFDDMQVSISNIRVPASNYPSERLYNMGVGSGVTFPVLGFEVDDYLYFQVQTSHSMKLNSILDAHIHYILPNTTNIGDKFKFQLDVVAAGVNVQEAVPTGSPFTSETAVSANDNNTHRLMELAEIPAVNSTVSTLYDCKLTRIAASANEYASEVYVKFIDCHYQKDSIGSNTEYTK